MLIETAMVGLSSGLGSWFVLVIIIPLCLWVGEPALQVSGPLVLRFVLPEHIETTDDVPVLRLARRWGWRPKVRIARGTLTSVLREWQHGARGVDRPLQRCGVRVLDGDLGEDAVALGASLLA